MLLDESSLTSCEFGEKSNITSCITMVKPLTDFTKVCIRSYPRLIFVIKTGRPPVDDVEKFHTSPDIFRQVCESKSENLLSRRGCRVLEVRPQAHDCDPNTLLEVCSLIKHPLCVLSLVIDVVRHSGFHGIFLFSRLTRDSCTRCCRNSSCCNLFVNTFLQISVDVQVTHVFDQHPTTNLTSKFNSVPFTNYGTAISPSAAAGGCPLG